MTMLMIEVLETKYRVIKDNDGEDGTNIRNER